MRQFLTILFCLFFLNSFSQKIEVINYKNSNLPEDNFIALEIDSNNQIWIGTSENGLFMFNGEKWINFNKSNTPLLGNSITNIKSDKNSIWLSFMSNKGLSYCGLANYLNGKWTLFSTKNGIPNNLISCIAVDNSNDIWIGTGSGLAKFENGKWLRKQVVINSVNYNSPISNILFDSNNNFWLSNSNGLLSYNDNSWKLYGNLIKESEFNMINSLFSKNNKLLISQSAGLTIFESGEFNQIELSKLDRKSVNSAVIDSNNNIWIGYIFGIVKMDSNGRILKKFESKKYPELYNIEKLLVGTDNKIYAIAGKSLIVISNI